MMAGESEIPVPVVSIAQDASAGNPPELAIPSPAPGVQEAAPPSVEAEAKIERSLLEEFDLAQAEKAKTDSKPAEAAKPAPEGEAAKPAVEAPKAEGEVAPAAAAELAPLAYEYKLPDTIRLDDTGREEVHKAFDEFRRDPGKGVQGLIDLHAKKMGEFAEQYAEHYNQNMHDAWNKTRRNWRLALASHPTLGGSGVETTKANAAHVRDVGFSQIAPERREAFRKEFNEALHVTGFGDHPAFFEFANALSKFFKEPEIPKMPGSPPAPQKRSLRAGFYKKTAS
jgi:hypothetical protein